jgi:hypothetical protein
LEVSNPEGMKIHATPSGFALNPAAFSPMVFYGIPQNLPNLTFEFLARNPFKKLTY